MRKTPKPPEKKLPLGAWVLAVLVAFLLSATAFFHLYAADPGRDDNLTSSELCQDSCARDQTVCMDSSGNRQALENYGDETTQRVGLQANCEKDFRECMRKCGVVSPLKAPPGNNSGAGPIPGVP